MGIVRKGYSGALEINDGSGLVISRPELQDGLTKNVEAGSAPVSYINEYHAEFDVDCAFCAKHTPHRHGYTVEMEDGRIALCGNHCASKFFGAERAHKLSLELGKRMESASLRAAVAKAKRSIAVLMELLADEILFFEQASVEAVKRISSETGHTPLRHEKIPGITALMFGSASQKLRLRDAREDMRALADLDLDADETDFRKSLAEFNATIAQIEIALRFLSHAALLFTRENFSAVARFCRSQGGRVDRFVMTIDPKGALVLHQHPRDRGPTKHIYFGTIPEIPTAEQLTAATVG